MNVTYACPQCDETARVEIGCGGAELSCRRGHRLAAPEDAIRDGRVQRCLACGSAELFVRKDFSQRLGLTIIAIGFAASSVAWYFYMKYVTFGILIGTALIDVALYLLMGDLLQCYRCRAEYRGAGGLEHHEPFRLETHERHRQQAVRLAAKAPPAEAANRELP